MLLSFIKTAGVLLGYLLKLVPLWLANRLGKKSQRLEQTEKELEEIDKANDIRDRLRNDSSFAKRVRERFRR